MSLKNLSRGDSGGTHKSEVIAIKLSGRPVTLLLDSLNERVKVLDYHTDNIIPLINYLNDLPNRSGFSKIIIIAREQDWKTFFANGYALEAINYSYFSGEPAFYMAKFLTRERGLSYDLVEEDKILNDVLQRPVKSSTMPLSSDYMLRDARPTDINEITLLYKKVFATYPFPITDPDYLSPLVNRGLFKIILYKDRIVSAASVELDPKNMAGELTDCVCLPEFEGFGLMSSIITALEDKFAKAGFNLYSIARAKSAGINRIFQKLGYTYSGRFINNCNICGQFEDMNLWIKPQNCTSS